jgi:hypothetical protein
MRAGTAALWAAAALCARGARAEEIRLEYHGAGWVQAGRIEHVSDTLSDGPGQDFEGNWTQTAGGQVTAVADLGGGWEGGLGLGAIQSHNLRGSRFNDKAVEIQWSPYVTEARLTYTLGDPAHPALQATAGFFPFDYNPDTKNLGLYLLRGTVYPGAVISGFESKAVLPIADIYGLDIRHESGGYRGDFLVNSEMDINPYFDISFAYLFHYRFLGAIEVGGGANWYRALASKPKITSPGKDCLNGTSEYFINGDDEEVCYILDTTAAGVDTVTGSLSGLKLMGRFSLDPKPLLGLDGVFGPQDLILYSEAAVLGVKDYPKYYDDVWQRIPVMLGFNLPAFRLLDVVSLEIEYYGNTNMSDFGKVVADNSWVPRPRAVFDVPDGKGGFTRARTDTYSDDWKWSLYASRIVAGHLKISGQVADDHFRSGGYFLANTQSETLTAPDDWYWMLKVAYYF